MIKSQFLISLILGLISFLATFFIFGYYFGWVDDVLQYNYFRGIPLGEPIEHFYTVHLGLSYLYKYLFSIYPAINWYGLFMGIYTLLATINFYYIILYLLCKTSLSQYLKLFCIPLILFCILWIDFIVFINFTKISILLLGTSLIGLDISLRQNLKRNRITIYFCFTFLIGLLTRPEVLIIILPLFLIYIIRGVHNKRKIIKICLLIFILIGIYKLLDYTSVKQSDRNKRNEVAHLLNITDGRNLNGKDFYALYRNDIKYRAVFMYFHPDSTFTNKKILDQWGPASSFSLKNLKGIKKKLEEEFYRASQYYDNQYHVYMNWLDRFSMVLIINILTIILATYKYYQYGSKNKTSILVLWLLLLCFCSSILIITSLSKMEERVAITTSIIFTLMVLNIYFENNQVPSNRKSVNVLITLILMTLVFFKLQTTYAIAKEKENELEQKANIIKEINTNFKNKILFFDIWTMTLLHQRAFENIYLNKNNTYLAYGEYWSNMIDSHKKTLEAICPNTDFINFYQCLYKKRKEVVFVYNTETRAQLIEKLSSEVYNMPIRFKKYMPNSELSKLHYSFLPFEYHFEYYVFDDSFEDYEHER